MLAIGLVLVSLPYKPKNKQQHLITSTSLCSKIVYIIVSGYGFKISVFTLVNTVIYDYCSPVPLCTYQCKAGEGGGGGQGMGWGFDCLCRPWGGAFDWSCSPRGGDIWIFPRPMWGYLTADSDERDRDRTYVSRFHASRMRLTVWKDLELMEANENKRKVSGFRCFVFKVCLF